MSPFSSLPIEVVARILGCSDDFTQLLNEIQACKRLHAVWQSNTGTIIWDIGTRDIDCFDDALQAVSYCSPLPSTRAAFIDLLILH